jgi:hypothetical protein
MLLQLFGWRGIVPALVAGVLLAPVVGCGRGDGDLGRLVPVQGKVMLGGGPLTTGVVIFRPDAAKGNASKHEPRSHIDAEGHYKLVTAQRHDGAAPGWYKVGVIAVLQSTDRKNPYALPKSLIPSIYNDPEKSPLALEVVEEPTPGAYDLQIGK